MQKTHVIIAVAMGALAHAWAGSQSDGDYTVNAHGTEAGNLTVQGAAEMQGAATVQGTLDIYSGLTLGETGETTPRSAVSFQYAEDGTNFTVTLSATRPETAFLWGDDGGGTPASKMKLDGNNILSLFNANGDATIVLDPATGNLNLEVSGGGLILSDGTELRQASDLQSSALYDAAGKAKVTIDGSGNLVVSAPATFEETLKANGGVEFAPGTVLNERKAGYLQDVLANLGYREGEATDLLIPVIGGTVSDFKFDASGDLYVTGHFSNRMSLGGGTFSNEGSATTFVAKVNSSGNAIWVNRLGGTGAASLALDASGNVYLTGSFQGTSWFGSTNLTSAGGNDVFVAKLDGLGNVTWAKRFGGAGEDIAVGLALDGSGNVHATGSFYGTAGFGGVNLASAGGADAYLAKLDGFGDVIWSRRFGGTGEDIAASLMLDGSGNAHVTGSFFGTAGFGGINLTSAGGQDVYVVKLDGSGNVTWAKRFGGTAYDKAAGLELDGSGHVYVAGHIQGTAGFGGVNLTSAGSTDAYVAKLDGSGNVTWAKRFGGTNVDEAVGLALDVNGNIYVAGRFAQTTNFGEFNLSASAGSWDFYVAKLDGFGNVTWVSQAGSAGSGFVNRIARSSTGKLGLAFLADSNFRIGNRIALGSSNSNLYLWQEGPILQSDEIEMPFQWGGVATKGGSAALGETSFASGRGSFAIGASIASGEFSSAFGTSQAKGYVATALGADSSASGDISTAMGRWTSASGYTSIAMGEGASASGETSTAMGRYTFATGYASTALGDSTMASAQSSLAIGRSNIGGGNPTQWDEQDPLFEIGNGDGWRQNPSNALTVLKNGRTTLTNKFWDEEEPIAIPEASGSSGGEAFVVEGHSVFKGRVQLPRQGDILMGEFGNPE